MFQIIQLDQIGPFSSVRLVVIFEIDFTCFLGQPVVPNVLYKMNKIKKQKESMHAFPRFVRHGLEHFEKFLVRWYKKFASKPLIGIILKRKVGPPIRFFIMMPNIVVASLLGSFSALPKTVPPWYSRACLTYISSTITTHCLWFSFNLPNASVKNFRSEVLLTFDVRFVSVFTLGSYNLYVAFDTNFLKLKSSSTLWWEYQESIPSCSRLLDASPRYVLSRHFLDA